MTFTRRNILFDENASSSFIEGVRALKGEYSGRNSSECGISGGDRPLSTYDLFVIWYYQGWLSDRFEEDCCQTEASSASVAAPLRSSASFPWRRILLLVFEENLRRILGQSDFALPYWDWSSDGDLPPGEQSRARLWHTEVLGGAGIPVTSGPFSCHEKRSNSRNTWRVAVECSPCGKLRTTQRGLRRGLGRGIVQSLPQSAHVRSALQSLQYDGQDAGFMETGFRQRMDGSSSPIIPWLANRVHLWVGGDMALPTAANDPVCFLSLCNLDRIWQRWIQNYQPSNEAPDSQETEPTLPVDSWLRISFPTPFGKNLTAQDVLDLSSCYAYDGLPRFGKQDYCKATA